MTNTLKSSFYLFIFILILTSCGNRVDFGDIYLTDINGNPIGGASDPNEWELTSDFDEEVSSYFSDFKDICSSTESYQMFAAYPNPFIDLVTFSLQANNGDILEIKIVDEEFNLLHEYISGSEINTGVNNITLDLEGSIPSDDVVRAYYRIIRDDCEYRGYGDLQKQ